MKPLITLIISTYNWKEALSLCLSSAISQTLPPNEIIIADDGSSDDTQLMIESYSEKTAIPILHVWHEDMGFRKTTILNMAIAKASGDYIIQVDGDVILNKFFIQDHMELAEKNYFICGSRVKLGIATTEKLLSGSSYGFNFFKQSYKSILNGLRIKFLRHYLSKRYSKNKFDRLRGCNMSFWKSDLIKVNGYNEDLTMWGHEDTELAYRLYYSGVQKKFVKMGGIVFHLHHKISSNENEHFHNDVLNEVNKTNSSWCINGLDKHLKS